MSTDCRSFRARQPRVPLPAIGCGAGAKGSVERAYLAGGFARAFRIHNMKTDAGRKRKIAVFVEMLRHGETIYPQPKSEPSSRGIAGDEPDLFGHGASRPKP